MKQWTHLLSGVAIAATMVHCAATVAVCRDQRAAPEGCRSHDDPGSTGPRLPHRAIRPSGRADVSVEA